MSSQNSPQLEAVRAISKRLLEAQRPNPGIIITLHKELAEAKKRGLPEHVQARIKARLRTAQNTPQAKPVEIAVLKKAHQEALSAWSASMPRTKKPPKCAHPGQKTAKNRRSRATEPNTAESAAIRTLAADTKKLVRLEQQKATRENVEWQTRYRVEAILANIERMKSPDLAVIERALQKERPAVRRGVLARLGTRTSA